MRLSKKTSSTTFILKEKWCKDTKEMTFVKFMGGEVTGKGSFVDITDEMYCFKYTNKVSRVVVTPNPKFPLYEELFANEDGSVDREKVQSSLEYQGC